MTQKLNINITPKAYKDLQRIARYTLKKWGQKQRHQYLKRLDQRFIWLSENPKAGNHRPDIHITYHCFAEGKHLIFYIIQENSIDIIGVLHQHSDVKQYL